MLVVIFSFLTIIGCFYWIKGNYSKFLTVVFLLLTNCININLTESIIKSQDFFLFLIVFCLLFPKDKSSGVLSVKGDAVGLIVRNIFVYLSLSFVITVSLGIESFSFALKVYRTFGYFLFYFIFRQIPICEFAKAFKNIFVISLIWGVLYIMQLFGVFLIKGSQEIDMTTGAISRIRNIPLTSVITITFIVISNIKPKIKILLILIWCGILVLSQHRGVMLSLLIAIPLLMIIRQQLKKIMILGIALGLVLCLFSSLIANRFSADSNDNGMSTIEEIKYGLSMNNYSSYDSGSGTFIFRLFLIKERVEYMLEDPIRLIVGNGMMHEDSPATARKFNFQLGTYKYVSGYPVMQQISTSDVGLLTFFFRFGLFFILLLVMLTCKMFRHFINNKNIGSDIGFVLLTYCFLRVLSGEEFTMLMFLQLFGCYIYSVKSIKNIQ